MQLALTFFYNITSKLGFPNYGVAIILLTASIKILMYPLTARQVKSMQKMRELGPRLKEIQEKHKGNNKEQQEEVAKVYKQAGINPLSGCLPMLIQMPFLTGIFYAIRDFHYISQPSFLWIRTLAGKDPFFILPILAALTTYVSSQQTVTEVSQQSKLMLVIMPLFIGFMAWRFPAGLGLYWVVSNVIQIIQQRFLYRVRV